MAALKQLWNREKPVMIGIAGGSGAGKTWLAQRLLREFRKEAALLSLDDFYRDRSHLPESTRNRINFDHPRAIDWPLLEYCLSELANGKKTEVPIYDFSSHSRAAKGKWKTFSAKPIIIMEGLWLFRRPRLRALFDYRIFVDCPSELRLQRRLARDCAERGRTENSVRNQFTTFVQPMHQRFVSPQEKWAHLVYTETLGDRDVAHIIHLIRCRANH